MKIHNIFILLFFLNAFSALSQDTSTLKNDVFIINQDTLFVTNEPIKKHLFFNLFDTLNTENKLIYGSFKVIDSNITYVFVEYDFSKNKYTKYLIKNNVTITQKLDIVHSDSINTQLLNQFSKEYYSNFINRIPPTCIHLEIQYIIFGNTKLLFMSDDYSHRILFNYFLNFVSTDLPK